MKAFLSLVWLALATGLATAAPYVVYSGSSSDGSLTTSGATHTSYSLFLIVDAGDTSNYALLQVNCSSKAGTISGYPISNPTAEQSNENFFGGITPSSGRTPSLAIFSSGSETLNSSNDTYVTRSYGTGPLNPRSMVLVAARPRPLVVPVRTNGVAGSSVTFDASTAISLGADTIPTILTGTIFDYTIASTGSLTEAATSGNFDLKENAALTTLANIGGGYTLGRSTFAVEPVTVADSETVTDALTDWLATFADDNSFSLPDTDDTSVGITGGTLSLGNTSSGGVTLGGTGTGTTILSGSNTYSGSTTISGGALIVTGTVTPTNGGTLSVTNSTGSSSGGVTFTLGAGSSTTAGTVLVGQNSASNINSTDVLQLGAGTQGSSSSIYGSTTLNFNLTGDSNTGTTTTSGSTITFGTSTTPTLTLTGTTTSTGTLVLITNGGSYTGTGLTFTGTTTLQP